MPDGDDTRGGPTQEVRRSRSAPPTGRAARRSANGSAKPPGKPVGARRRRTRSVVRKIDAWSVLKVSVVFYVTLYCILIVAAVLLWTAASATGLRTNVEKFIADLIASGKFHFVGGELFRASAIGGAVLVVMGSAANVLAVVLYNLISDMVGGLTFVVEERPSRRSRAAAAEAPVVEVQPAPALIPEAELRQSRPTADRGPVSAASPPPPLGRANPVAATTAVPPAVPPGATGSAGPISPTTSNL